LSFAKGRNEFMPEYDYDRAELIRRRTAAEKLLTENKELTKEQRDYFIKVIQESDSKLAGTYTGTHKEPNKSDDPSTGLNILALLFPLIGLVLYIVFNDSSPNKAHAIGKWALIGFCISAVLTVLSSFSLFFL